MEASASLQDVKCAKSATIEDTNVHICLHTNMCMCTVYSICILHTLFSVHASSSLKSPLGTGSVQQKYFQL